MGQPKPACQTPKERAANFREVSFGFNKKISADEARRCPQCAQPTCLSGCPLGIDIPGFIRLLRESDAPAALERIKNDNPFPAICGRICPAPCEKACVFEDEGAPIAIRALERYASDFGRKPVSKNRIAPQFNGKKAVIVGSGPSAMMAASILLKEKIQVTMFEAAPEPGGVLRYGIPEFRLPKEVLEEQFEQLLSLGLELHTNVLVGRTKSLAELVNTFDAVLLAMGAGMPEFSNIEGEGLTGVYYASELLIRLQMMSKDKIGSSSPAVLRGDKTVVVGRGYPALDAARTALRLGQKVDLIFEGLEEEMGVSQDDLKAALDEGLNIHAPFRVLKIEGDAKGFVQAVRGHRLEMVEKEGQLSLIPSQDEAQIFEAQSVVLANGQRSNVFLAKSNSQLRLNEDGSLWVEKQSSKTSLDKVFALGAVLNESMSVVEAFADGKAAALEIVEKLK